VADPLRVAVIGLGSMGGNHARVLSELPDAELVAVADVDEPRLQQAVRDRSARPYTDYRRLLAEEQLDAVAIAVPTRRHLEVALACIEHGVPVLVEKPLATDMDECLRLREAAEVKGVALMVGHVERFNPAVQELKRRLDAGELGRIYQLHARRTGPFYERERDVGVVHDLATHDIDVLRYVLGCEVERVQAETRSGLRTPYEDVLVGLLGFEHGAIGVLEVNWLTPVKVRELAVLGERGMFVVDYLTQELSFYESAVGEAAGTAGWPIVPGEGAVTRLPVDRQEPLRAELAAFLRMARGLQPPPVSAGDAIAAMRVVEALVESARRGEAVRLTAGRAAG
jgi:predicted dehydrogenase